jgi:hypothetical protein
VWATLQHRENATSEPRGVYAAICVVDVCHVFVIAWKVCLSESVVDASAGSPSVNA